MNFEEPVLELHHGSGVEADEQARNDLRRARADMTLPTLDDLLGAYPEFAGATCVFMSGSVTMGWGNESSDIDVFVITAEPFPTSESNLLFIEQRVSTADPVAWIAVGELGAFRADIEIWHEAQVEELIERFGRDADAPGRYRGYNGPFGFAERELFYRLTAGVPLIGEPWWQQRADAILTSDYRLWLAEEVKNAVENRLEDAVGMLKAEDYESAVLAAHQTLIHSLTALLATYGDFSQQPKWLYRRLCAYTPAEVTVPDAWRLLSMAGAYESPGEWVRAATDLASRLVLAVEKRMS